MKNKEITMYELIRLIKDDKAPKKIKYNNKTFIFNEDRDDYENKYDKNWSFLYKRLGETVNFVDDFLNDTIEIPPEENDEWEDIEEIDSNADDTLFTMECYTGIPEKAQDWNFNILENKINQLIKNQKYLKEKLDKYVRKD